MLSEFIQERYIVFAADDSGIFFTSIDGKTGGGIITREIGYSIYYMVVYFQTNEKSDRSGELNHNRIKEIVNEIKNDIIL